MKKIMSYNLLLSLLAGLWSCSAPPEFPPPNVLFIAIDDLKPMLGAYGDTTVHTPNMDRLAARGTVFLNNHCQQAVCGPARASLLTGLYPDQIRAWGFERQMRDAPFEVLTLPQHFKNQGYYTVGISKIFDYRNVDPYRDSLSWSEPAFPLTEEELTPHYAEGYGPLMGYFYRSEMVKNKQDSLVQANPEIAARPEPYLHKVIKPATECLDVPDDAYKDGVFANRAVDYLKQLSKRDQPFFLAVGFERPHLPYTAPEKYWDLYERDEIALAPFQEHARDDVDFAYTNSGSIKSYSDESGNFIYKKLGKGGRLTEAEQRKLLHGYMASVSYIDAQVGKVLQAVEGLGLKENTIVVLWGDHGYHLYGHGMWGKSTNFEQGTRSPMIISAPGIAPGRTPVATEFTDLFPTLCELSGVEVPPHLSGQTLVGLMKGNEQSVKGYAISQFQRDEKMGYAIRDGRYRYVEWVAEGRHVNPEARLDEVVATQLFDYKTDPLETINLAGQPEYAEVENELKEKLAAFYWKQVLEWRP